MNEEAQLLRQLENKVLGIANSYQVNRRQDEAVLALTKVADEVRQVRLRKHGLGLLAEFEKTRHD